MYRKCIEDDGRQTQRLHLASRLEYVCVITYSIDALVYWMGLASDELETQMYKSVLSSQGHTDNDYNTVGGEERFRCVSFLISPLGIWEDMDNKAICTKYSATKYLLLFACYFYTIKRSLTFLCHQQFEVSKDCLWRAEKDFELFAERK